jgi:hypothetical protein
VVTTVKSIAVTTSARTPLTKSGCRAISPTVGPLGRIAAEIRLRLVERGLKMRERNPMVVVLFGRLAWKIGAVLAWRNFSGGWWSESSLASYGPLVPSVHIDHFGGGDRRDTSWGIQQTGKTPNASEILDYRTFSALRPILGRVAGVWS